MEWWRVSHADDPTTFLLECPEVQRPAAWELAAICALSFALSALLSALPSTLSQRFWLGARFRQLPKSQKWRVRATTSTLHQPFAMLFLSPPHLAYRMLLHYDKPWLLAPPTSVWLAVYYLIGAWLFEALVLLHPSTETRKSYGAKGWTLQLIHHLGFPGFALQNLHSGCGSPAVAYACSTEITVFFTGVYYLLKAAGVDDQSFSAYQCRNLMLIVTMVLRGLLLLAVNYQGLWSDFSGVPWLSWSINMVGLILTNFLNIFITKAVHGAVFRKKAEGRARRREQEAVQSRAPLREKRALVHSSPAAKAPQATHSVELTEVSELLAQLVAEAAGTTVASDTPLLDSGMDSKAALVLFTRLSQTYPDVELSSTTVFDYPTIAALAHYIGVQQGWNGVDADPTTVLRSPRVCTSQDSDIGIYGLACSFPGNAGGAQRYHCHLHAGTDGVIEIPFTRWELEEYYDPNPDALAKSYVRHGAFIDGADRFDASFFGISPPEARAMDPQQRLMLEVSYEGLLSAGETQKSLLGSDVGVFVGLTNNDWIQVQSGDLKKLSPFTATGTSASVAAARISFALGTKGPSYIVDTACSSALVALDSAVANMQRGRCSRAVSSAANVMASAATYISFSKPRMLSVDGRCFTFDASANGYGRGEGAAAASLAESSHRPLGAAVNVAGIAVNQDGRSSTMTAPNGPSQQQVILIALADAGLKPLDVYHMECHGTGTPLGDPIELGALQAVNSGREARQPLVLAGVKSNIGHLEGAAASTGLLKLALLLQRFAPLPGLHLRCLNPHLEAFTKLPKNLASELIPGLERNPAVHPIGALSSFGFGGTNAHGVLVDNCSSEPTYGSCQTVAATFRRKPFAWREVGYRLLRLQPSSTAFEVAVCADLYDTVKDHVVFGSIVVPGVVYMEMAMEAVQKLYGRGMVQITSVTMVFPFVVPYVEDVQVEAPRMRFVLRGEKNFEIQSTSASGKVTQHVEASLDKGATRGAEPQKADLAALQARINEPVDTASVYDAINSVGLRLGPSFQVAQSLWRYQDEHSNEVLARLQLAGSVPNNGYVMHPALLDGTIHTLATASIGKDHVGGLMIFGGVGRVSVVGKDDFSQLSEYWAHLMITDTQATSQTFNVRVLGPDGSALLLLEDVVFRSVKPEQIQMAIAAQGGQEDDQKMYEVSWAGLAPEPAPKLEGRCLVLADEPLLGHLRSDMGPDHVYSSTFQNGVTADLSVYDKVVHALACSTLDVIDMLYSAVVILKAAAALVGKEGGPPSLVFITQSSQAVLAGDMTDGQFPVGACIWGLLKSFRNEQPTVQVSCLDIRSLEGWSASETIAQSWMHSEPEMALRAAEDTDDTSHRFHRPRLSELSAAQLQNKDGSPPFTCNDTFLISGGLGGLGLSVAIWMHEVGAARLCLLSRSGQPPPECRTLLQRLGSAAVICKGDVANAAEVSAMVKQAAGDEQYPLRGIVHAAGVLDDHMIVDMERKHLGKVLSAKVDGTLHLHQSATDLSLDHFIMFSSLAAVIGTPGQANYAAANAFMDSLSAFRRDNGLPAASIQWGPWAEVGMAVRANTSEASIARISPAKGLQALQAIMAASTGGSVRSGGVVCVARIKWKVLLGMIPRVPPLLSKFAEKSLASHGTTNASNLAKNDVVAIITGTLKEVLDAEDLDLTTPFMELGLDSLSGVEFRNRLQGSLEGLQLSPTLMFDYPTVMDLVDYVWEQVGPAEGEDAAVGAPELGAGVGEQLAIIGCAARLPGSSTNNIEEYWRTLSSGLDSTAKLPPERWDIDAYYDSDPDAPGKTYVKVGHFIPGTDSFDGAFFGIAEAEQRGMDPHQWLAVEIAYDAFYHAGETKETLNGFDCAVYVGCATLGGVDLIYDAVGPFTNIGYAYSGLSGRVSHVLSLRGQCFTLDTACSSTIVALDCANQALQLGKSRGALAAGVNIQISAAVWVGFSKMRGLASDGNCKTFDVSADGFARAEGLAAAFVKRASAAADAAQDNGPIGLVAGIAINHDGRAATITAPNGTAQQRVIRSALAERSVQTSEVGCLEAHGTGTALGDPIEVGSQKAVYGKGHPKDNPLILAAGKSNLGHTEGSAGLAGIGKLFLILSHWCVPPNMRLRQMNPNIDLSAFEVMMPVESVACSKVAAPLASVSSFGFSGTNGHALAQARATPPDARKKLAKHISRPLPRYTRRLLRPARTWLPDVLYREEWVDALAMPAAEIAKPKSCLVVGNGPATSSVSKALSCTAIKAAKAPDAIKAQEAIDLVVYMAAVDATPEHDCESCLLPLADTLKAICGGTSVSTFVLVTRGATNPLRVDFDSSNALWGLCRSMRLEFPKTTWKIVDVEVDAAAASVADIVTREYVLCSAGELEVVALASGRKVPRLMAMPSEAAAALQRCDAMIDAATLGSGAQVVTGGLGGIGLLAAQQLVDLGAEHLVLTSRSGKVQPGFGLEGRLARLQAHSNVTLKQCDVSSSEEIAQLWRGIDAVGGVVHAAGVLKTAPLKQATTEDICDVLRPKCRGAWHLHDAAKQGIGHFICISSISSILGIAGGASYAAANAYLDHLAKWRRGKQLPAQSIQLGPVAEVGLTAASGGDAHKSEGMSLQLLAPEEVASTMRILLTQQGPQPPKLGNADLLLAKARWGLFMRDLGVDIPHLVDFESSDDAAQTSNAFTAEALVSKDAVLASLRAAASGMGLELEDDTPLMESGIDSLSAVEFRSKVAASFRQVKLPSTLMFDYPTIAALASYIAGQMSGANHSAGGRLALDAISRPPAQSSAAIAVMGGHARFPTGDEGLVAFHASLRAGTDGITEIPYDRWDVDEYFHSEAPTGLEIYVRHAGFIEGSNLFDAATFNISKPEAESMDPQQRHLLETTFVAFVNAGFSKGSTVGKAGGIYVGQDKCDWNRMLTTAHAGPFAATGGSSSISSNRISYSLGLKGPSCTIDTACSSSLVAADTACMTLRRQRCDVAAVAGVNMLLLPQTFIACCQARMLSTDGRCRTFDSSAGGYARGEGCGAVVTERASERAALALLLGTAINQDGRSANLTSPNGPSQESVVRMALAEADVAPQALTSLEAHGTGTELGDPIEVGALQAALGSKRSQPLMLGAVKTNTGHLEGGAGLVGMIKLVVCLSANQSAHPSLHLRQANVHLHGDISDFAVAFTMDSGKLDPALPSTASVSSFGFGGTNGHVVAGAVSSKGTRATRAPRVTLTQRPFPWRSAVHPLLRHRSTKPDGTKVYSSEIDGHVLELLSHHIVHGEVVVPGACYLEMILAGVTDHLGPSAPWRVEELGFTRPLVLRVAEGGLEAPVELCLVIKKDGHLEVESKTGADEQRITTSHVEATLVPLPGTWASARPADSDSFNLPGLRSACPEDINIDQMYSYGVASGLPLQRRFRAVRQVQVQKSEMMGVARLEMERDGTHVGFLVGPSVLDSTFQSLMGLVDPEVGLGSLKIPLSIKVLQPTGRPFAIGVWSHFKLQEYTDHSTIFSAWLMNDVGETMIHFSQVHLQEVRDEHIQRMLQDTTQDDSAQMLYSIDWRAAPMPDDEVAGDAEEQTWKMLLIGPADALQRFDELDPRFEALTLQSPDDLSSEMLQSAMQKSNATAIGFTGGLSHMWSDVDVLYCSLRLVGILEPMHSTCPLWVLTDGAQPCASMEAEVRSRGDPTHAGLWGFIRAATLEYPETLDLRGLDLQPGIPAGVQVLQVVKAAKLHQEPPEREVAYRANETRVNRLRRSDVKAAGATRLRMATRGALTNLKLVPQSRRPALTEGFVQLRTRAIGLNFRDVLNVMGLYPGDPGPPGADCAGTVLDLGNGVEHLRVAEDVFGEAPGCLSTYSLGPAPLLTQKPTTWSFEEAASMPVIFVTVEEALGDVAKLTKGERVLIHAAAGGVGLVAIQYAIFVGAEVFATAGSEDKHAFLRKLGVKHISTTRDGERFETEMRQMLAEIGADGVDVVLNSLSHDNYIGRSLSLLKTNGRFMEIGKRGIWTHAQMSTERPDVQYTCIAADTMMETEPWRYNDYLKRLLKRVHDGGLRPINMHVFDGLERGAAALQFLQRAQNIGKVIISEPGNMQSLCKATPLLSGGMGALGLVTAKFLVEEGVKSVCLLSRSGKAQAEVAALWSWLQSSRVQVHVPKCNVSEEESVEALRSNGAFSGLFHLAGVLADSMLPSMTRDLLRASYAPKVHGLQNLAKLDFAPDSPFVLFSSTSSLFGSPGQANYAAANAVLDSVSPTWTAQNIRPTKTIQWGAWAEVGMAVQKGTVQRLSAGGMGALQNSQGMAIMAGMLGSAEASLVGAVRIRWQTFLRTAYLQPPPFLEDFLAEASRAEPSSSSSAAGPSSSLVALPPEERRAAIREALHRLAREVIDDEALAADAPLLESGMDSLSAVEFRNRLLAEFGNIRIPNAAVFDYPTVDKLALFVEERLGFGQEIGKDKLAQQDTSSVAATPALWDSLNEREHGRAIFFIPGAGMQSGGFRPLASMLPLPAYGCSWPQGLRPREDWPTSLESFAALLLKEAQLLQPSGPYIFIGHSFGATLCLEMARLVEANGDKVDLTLLLDPRSLLPLEVDVGAAFEEGGLAATVALLAQTASEASQYESKFQAVADLAREEREAKLRTMFSPGTLGQLDHFHITSQWYAQLLTEADGASASHLAQLSCHKVVLQAEETWLEADQREASSTAVATGRFQAETFQANTIVEGRLAQLSSVDKEVPVRQVPGGHFGMLREPFVGSTALGICHALVEAGIGNVWR